MGKKNNHFPNSRYNTVDYEEDQLDQEEDLASDLEIQDNGEESEEIKEINLVDELNAHTEKIQKEFTNLLAKKGATNNWLETLSLTHPNSINENLNIDDDIKRELEFYNLTTENVMRGLMKLKEVL